MPKCCPKCINFFCPILENFCPLFKHFAQMGICPKGLSIDFAVKRFDWKQWLSYGKVCESDCHMTSRSSNLDSNLNSAAWPTGYIGFVCSKSLKLNLNKLCGVWILLRSVKDVAGIPGKRSNFNAQAPGWLPPQFIKFYTQWFVLSY